MHTRSRALRFFLASLTLCLVFGQPFPQNPAAIARQALDFLLQQRFSDLRAMFDEKMSQQVTEDTLESTVAPQLNSLGGVASIGEPLIQQNQGYEVFTFPVQFEAGKFNVIFSVDAQGRIAGMFLQPGQSGAALAAQWTRPSYSDPSRFREIHVTVGRAPWSLPGSLLMPIGTGPFPGLVLVQGSGPRDRDETIGPNRPFLDLAEGLASRGIAVLRYDKRTFVYAQQMATLPNLTVEQEVTEDARSAVALLQHQPGVNPSRIFLLGHSLGGYLAPRIAKQDAAIAGLIIMAGNARPIPQLILEQSQALGVPAQQIEQLKKEIARFNALRPGQADSERFLGVPASYWLDLKNYDPTTVAQNLQIPMLILQGGRDYQVTQTDYELWKSALEGKRNVTFHEYPDLNHLFMHGQGRSTPAEYEQPGHVSFEVVDQIARWIRGLSAQESAKPVSQRAR
jgi:dienelactone hydrolase